jgi:hypothetical protein
MWYFAQMAGIAMSWQGRGHARQLKAQRWLFSSGAAGEAAATTREVQHTAAVSPYSRTHTAESRVWPPIRLGLDFLALVGGGLLRRWTDAQQLYRKYAICCPLPLRSPAGPM